MDLLTFRKHPPKIIDWQMHIEAAVDWINQAYQATGERGISKGYDLLRRRWAAAYPETTGYTIPTLLNLAEHLQRHDLSAMAVSLANYLLEAITPEGGVAHWQNTSSSQPVVFDTGQVIFGWLAAFLSSGDERYLQAAERSGKWLVSIQDVAGFWQRYQHLGVIKVIDTRVSWALLELHRLTGHASLMDAALRNLEWVLGQQTENGWFKRCSFKEGWNPITHTIAYTIEGLFESGVILDEGRFVDAARNTAEMLLELQRQNGGLAGAYRSDWNEADRSSCLTGNCQMSHVWLRFYELEGGYQYLDAAKKALDFVASTQPMDTRNANVRGAVAGSFPIYGSYERFKYPNWATKFFIDAWLRLHQVDHQVKSIRYIG